MPRRLERGELDDLRDRSRRGGREAAGAAPLDDDPPDDRRPLAGLPLPRGLMAEDLTALEIAAIGDAWLDGYRERMSARRAAGEEPRTEPVLWWSPAVAGGRRAGWRYRRSGAGGGPLVGAEQLGAEATDATVRRLAVEGGAPGGDGTDWSIAQVRRPGAPHATGDDEAGD